MKARQLIDGAGEFFGPDALKVIWKAFDDAWSAIEGNFGEGRSREAARLKLAAAILATARANSRDPEKLKNAALQAMALSYRDRSDPEGPFAN